MKLPILILGSATVADTPLVLNGAGLRRRLFLRSMSAYSISR
jgi:hypothetical protein